MADTLTPALDSISLQPWQSGSSLPSMLPPFKPAAAAAPPPPPPAPTAAPAAPPAAPAAKAPKQVALPFPELMRSAPPAAPSTQADPLEQRLIQSDKDYAEAVLKQGQSEADVKRRQAELDAITAQGVWDRQRDVDAQIKALDPGPFKPQQDNLAQMAGLFTLVGMMGAFLGGKGSVNAAGNAQAALSGMLKGWSDGNDAEVARQKQIYDENAQYLKDRIGKVRDSFTDFQTNVAKVGLPGAQAQQARDLLTNAEADNLHNTATTSYRQALQKQSEDLYKLDAAHKEKEFGLEMSFREHMDQIAFAADVKASTGGGGTQLTDQTKDWIANNVATTGDLSMVPKYGPLGKDNWADIMNRAAAANPSLLPGIQKANVSADRTALVNNTRKLEMIETSLNTLELNKGIALDEMKKRTPISNLSPWVNGWIQSGEIGAGNPDQPALATALITVMDQLAKQQSGGTGAAGTPVQFMERAKDEVNTKYNNGQLESVFGIIEKDSNNQKKSLMAERAGIEKEMRSGLFATGAPGTPGNVSVGLTDPVTDKTPKQNPVVTLPTPYMGKKVLVGEQLKQGKHTIEVVEVNDDHYATKYRVID